MWSNLRVTADLVTFTQKILNGKLLCAVQASSLAVVNVGALQDSIAGTLLFLIYI